VNEINVSQIKAFRQCPRLWAFGYVYGVQSTGPALILGTAVHKLLESYLRDGTPIPDPGEALLLAHGAYETTLRYPGAIASRGIHCLPYGGLWQVEHEWKAVFQGVHFRGTYDARMIGGETPWVIDHKTTSGRRYALTPETLATDPQWIVYGWSTAEEFDAGTVAGMWVYYPTKGPDAVPGGGWSVEISDSRFALNQAMACDILPTALEILGTAERLRLPILDVKTATPRPEIADPAARLEILRALPVDASDGRCQKYGGCAHRNLCSDLHPRFEGGQTTDTRSLLERITGKTTMSPPVLPKEVLLSAALKRLETEPLAPGWQRYPSPEHAEWLVPPRSVAAHGVSVLEYLEKYHPAPIVQAPPVAPKAPEPPALPPPVASSTPATPGQINPPLPPVVESARDAVAMDAAPLGPPAPVPPVVPGGPKVEPTGMLAAAVSTPAQVAPREPLTVSEELRRDAIARGLWTPSSGKPPSDANLKLCLERGVPWKTLQAEQKATADAERAAKASAKGKTAESVVPQTPPAVASAPPVPSSTPERYLSPGWAQHPSAPDAEMGGFPMYVRAKPLVGWRYQSDEKTAAMVETMPETRKAPPVVESAPVPPVAPVPPAVEPVYTPREALPPVQPPVVERAPVESPQGYRDGRGFVLLVNCHRTTGRVTLFSRIFPEVMEAFCRVSFPQERGPNLVGVHDYRLIPFGKGLPTYHDLLREYLSGERGLDAEDYLSVDTGTAEGRDALCVLESLAGEVFRGY